MSSDNTDRADRSKSGNRVAGLFLLDLTTADYRPIPLPVSLPHGFEPHGISFFKKDSTYQVVAINHTAAGHSIEVFELNGKQLTHQQTLTDPAMISPNDLVMVDENRFYFTNDHGYTQGIKKFLEEYLGLAVSNVVYFDGQQFRVAAGGIALANGINYDGQRQLLFVASARGFFINVYAHNKRGELTFIEKIPCGTGVDNIELDTAGNLWVGAHPNLLGFTAYYKGDEAIAPSEIIKISYRQQGEYSVETIYLDDGSEISASSVAVPFGDLIFVGNVMDDEFLVLQYRGK